jgi:hypothetical protein
MSAPAKALSSPTITDPLAEIERELLHTYLAGAGEDLQALMQRDDPAARRLLAQATQFVTERLAEIEARAVYLHKLRDAQSG